MGKVRLYLLPGFFGFSNLGDMLYFGHVRDQLTREWRRRGLEVEVHEVVSHPTTSIRTRARDLLALLARTASDDPPDAPIHLIGHSTGGLDARLFVSTAADLGDVNGLPPVETFARRVRSVVCVATPNRGTGLAGFFTGMMGAKLLRLFSLFTVYVLRYGHLPLRHGLRLGGLLMRLRRLGDRRDTLLDQLFAELLSEFSPDRREALQAFLTQVSTDQALLFQLTAEGIDLFNASATRRPTVRYGSVVTQARRPTVASRLAQGFSPYAQVTHNLYAFLHARARQRPLPLTPAHDAALRAGFGAIPTFRDSDGIVPTLSQPWGDVIASVRADHLDVIGHFSDFEHEPPHVDWLTSATGFRRAQFEEVWTRVTDYVVAAGR